MAELVLALLVALLWAMAGGPLGELGNRIAGRVAAYAKRRTRPGVAQSEDTLLPANANRLLSGSYASAPAVSPGFDVDVLVVTSPDADHVGPKDR